jgi:dienelactone hydrolase
MNLLRSALLRVGVTLLSATAFACGALADDKTAPIKALAPYFHTYRPSGPGPFPTILFVSGCLGFAPATAPHAYTSLAETWKAKGYVVVFVDYLRARGAQQCGGDLAPADVGRAALAVAAYVQSQPFVKASRVTAFGWSLGGSGVLAALGLIKPGQPSPLHTVVAYTPVCSALEAWTVKVPALVLMGADDEIANPALCQQLFAQLPPGTPLDAHLYPGAGHVFDLPGDGYNAGVAAAAAEVVDRFMSK